MVTRLAEIADQGGPARPATILNSGGYTEPHPGMTLRDYFAAHAPIDMKAVLAVWGDQSLAGLPGEDAGRAGFMAVWTLLRYEYADAMLDQRKQ